MSKGDTVQSNIAIGSNALGAEHRSRVETCAEDGCVRVLDHLGHVIVQGHPGQPLILGRVGVRYAASLLVRELRVAIRSGRRG